jgi:hypothetical protein
MRQQRREVRATSNGLGDFELLGCVVARVTKRLGDTRSVPRQIVRLELVSLEKDLEERGAA